MRATLHANGVRMHEDQIEIAADTVANLVAYQFPHWRTLQIRPVTSYGTVNVLFRLGDELILRFPMQLGDPAEKRLSLAAEADAARRLLGRVPVATPDPVAFGEPGYGYPLPWSVYRWLPGTIASDAAVAGSADFARDLAGFVAALRSMDTEGRTFHGRGRGGLLPGQDDYVASCLSRSRGLIDVDALAQLWQRLRSTPRAKEADLWTHGDLMPGNLLVQAGRLSAVIDIGGLAPADPAVDLMPAWNLFHPEARDAYRAALGVADAEWDRGKGWALVQAIGCLHYYRATNPVMSETARRTLNSLLQPHRPEWSKV